MLPEKGIRRRRPTNTLTEEEVYKILKYWPQNSPYRFMVLIQYALGLRSCEVVPIQIWDFSEDFKRLNVRLAKNKYDKIVCRVLPDKLAEQIKYYVQTNLHTFKNGYIFPALGHGTKYSHIQKNTYWEQFRRARNAAGLNDFELIDATGKKMYRVTTHSLRRKYLSNIVNNKMCDPEDARKIIGHAKLDTTLTYIYEDAQVRVLERMANNNNYKKLQQCVTLLE